MPRIDAIRSERVRLFGTRVGEDELPHCGAIEVTSAQGASRSFFVQAQHLAMADLLGDQALAADGDPLQERSISQVLVIALRHDDDEHQLGAPQEPLSVTCRATRSKSSTTRALTIAGHNTVWTVDRSAIRTDMPRPRRRMRDKCDGRAGA